MVPKIFLAYFSWLLPEEKPHLSFRQQPPCPRRQPSLAHPPRSSIIYIVPTATRKSTHAQTNNKSQQFSPRYRLLFLIRPITRLLPLRHVFHPCRRSHPPAPAQPIVSSPAEPNKTKVNITMRNLFKAKLFVTYKSSGSRRKITPPKKK